MPVDDLELYGPLLLEEIDEEEEDEEEELLAAASMGLMVYGAEEARQYRNERRRMHRHYLVRADLLPNPREKNPWTKLYEARNDGAFITTMGVDVPLFDFILQSGFAERWETETIPRHDTPATGFPHPSRRSLDSAGALGLVLHYLTSTMLEVSMMQIFALTQSTVSRYISFTLKILLYTLRQMDDARINWLQGEEFHERNVLITDRHPLLTGAFGSLDGLNLPVQTSKDVEIENATYNGWLSEHFVSSVLAFCSQGEIIAAHMNAPGSWHDSRVARPIYEKLRSQTPKGWYLVADTAFPQGPADVKGRIKAPMKAGTRLPANQRALDKKVAFDRQLLSYRQTAEWGMRAIQGSFGRLRIPLPIDDMHRRADILEIIARLHNLRTRRVGINQIRTVYMPIWKKGEQEELWNNFENILFGEQQRRDRVTQYHLEVVFDN